MTPLVVLFGPTGVGKTAFLSSLPHGFEVIAADSIQVYRRLDIGSAKPSLEERARVPHHLIDIRDPDQAFDVGDFVSEATRAADETAARGHVPVVSGGTAYYVQSLLFGMPETPPSDPVIREAVKETWEREGESVFRMALAAVDPESEARIQRGDAYRLQRAREVWLQTGRPLSSYKRFQNPAFRNAFVAGLDRPRETLYHRIDQRVDAMFAEGLEAEVATLAADGWRPDHPGMRGIGYAEWFPEILTGLDDSRRAAIRANIAKNSRRYAKRQLTFFRSLPGVRWYDPDRPEFLLADLREWSLTNALSWW
jgi:tRNA dimethylallyltransferase